MESKEKQSMIGFWSFSYNAGDQLEKVGPNFWSCNPVVSIQAIYRKQRKAYSWGIVLDFILD